MARLIASFLFYAIIVNIMFAFHVQIGSLSQREIWITFFAVLAIPYSYSQWNTTEFSKLGIIYGISLLSSAIGAFFHPNALVEYVKACFVLGISHFTSYLIYIFILSFPRKDLYLLFHRYSIILLIVCAAEIIVPGARAISSQISDSLYTAHSGADAGAKNDSNYHEQRDIRLHGGFLRPLACTQEPSFPAISLGFTTALAYTLSPRRRSNTNAFLGIALTAALLTRSFSYLASLIAVTAPVLVRRLTFNRIAVGFASTALISLVLLPFTWTRIADISQGDDTSFAVRVTCAFALVSCVFEETYGLYGIGIVGGLHDRSTKNLDEFESLWVNTIQRSNADGLFWAAQFRNIELAFLPAATHWAYMGIPLGLLSCLAWYRFYSFRSDYFAGWMFFVFTIFSFAYGGYEQIRLHAYMLMVAAAYLKSLEPFDDDRTDLLDDALDDEF